jgi:DNA-binding beta-propeller fold protein YncE
LWDLRDAAAPSRLTVDAAGNLYVADLGDGYGRIQKRDAQGNWSVITTWGTNIGQVESPLALAVDRADNLYVADLSGDGLGRIQKRDAQGIWSVIASGGSGAGQVFFYLDSYVNSTAGLAVDAAGNLYVADRGNNRVLKYTPAP